MRRTELEKSMLDIAQIEQLVKETAALGILLGRRLREFWTQIGLKAYYRGHSDGLVFIVPYLGLREKGRAKKSSSFLVFIRFLYL